MTKHQFKPGDLVTVDFRWGSRPGAIPAKVLTTFSGYQLIVILENGMRRKVTSGQCKGPLTEKEYFLAILTNGT